jgi:membrane protease YdiL (CAAX protease family)
MLGEPSMLDPAGSPHAGAAVGVYALLLGIGVLAALGLAAAYARGPDAWSLGLRRVRHRPWRGRDAGLIAAGLVFLLLLNYAAAWALPPLSDDASLMFHTLLFDGVGLVLLGVYMRRRGISCGRAFGAPRRRFSRHLLRAALYYVAALPILFFASLVYQVILNRLGYAPSLQDVAVLLTESQSVWIQAYLLVLAVLLAPWFEECLFRGIALPLLTRVAGVGPAVLVTSVGFAAIHFHMPSVVPLGVAALAFALGYVYTGSLWVPVLMHSVFNGVNLGLLLLLRP